MKTSWGELKEHYLETGRCEAVYLTVICWPILAQPWAISIWRWGGSFPHWGAKALWLQLVLLPSTGLAGQFCPSTDAAYNKHQHRGGWEVSPLEHAADLTECQTEFASHPFLPQSMVPLTGKAICVAAFSSYLGEGNETELSYCSQSDVVKQFKWPIACKPSPDCVASTWVRSSSKGWVPRVPLILVFLSKPSLLCYQLFSWKSLVGVERRCCGTLLRPHLLRACIDLCLSL